MIVPLADILQRSRRTLAVAMLITGIAEILSLAPVIYMWNMYDRVLSSGSGVTLVSLTVLVVGMFGLWSTMDWLRQRLLIRLALRLDWDVAPAVFRACYAARAQGKPADVQRALSDVTMVRQFMTGQPMITILDLPFVLLFIAVGALFHPLLAAFVAATTVILGLATFVGHKVSRDILSCAQREQMSALQVADAAMRHADTTLVMGMRPTLRRHWHNRHRSFLGRQVNASEAAGLAGGISGFLVRVLPSLQVALGIWLAIQGEITGGMVIAASLLISKAVQPMQRLIGSWQEIVNARDAYRRLQDLTATGEQQRERLALPKPEGRLVVRNLEVRAPNGKLILEQVAFTIAPGNVVAVVGPSGAGKTALMRAILGIWPSAAGSIRLDGIDAGDFPHDDLGGSIGYVPQEVVLFDGTVAENIARLGTPDPVAVIEAARKAGLHEAILRLPAGYDTPLGMNGAILSGGQRQRIAIARALYGDPQFIVLDEPNANLDETGESILLRTIAALKDEGVGILLSTHRPRLIGVADHLLVLRDGKQIGFGSAREALTALQQQAGGGLPRPASTGGREAVAATGA